MRVSSLRSVCVEKDRDGDRQGEGGTKRETETQTQTQCATVLNEGNKVHTERLPSQESASGSSY
jgi:hypothetical protein